MKYTYLCLSLVYLTTMGCQTVLEPIPSRAQPVIQKSSYFVKSSPSSSRHELPYLHSDQSTGHILTPQARQVRTLIAAQEGIPLPTCQPLIQNNTLFMMKSTGCVSAFKAGKLLWKSSIKPCNPPYEALGAGGFSLRDDKLAVTTPWGDLAVLDASTGKIMWHVSPSAPARGAPWWSEDRLGIITATQRFESFHPITGKSLGWDPQIAQSPVVWQPSSPASSSSLLVIARGSNTLVALNPRTVTPLWSYSIPTTSSLSPSLKSTLHSGKVFFSGCQTGCLDSHSGELIWRLPITTFTKPLVCGNMVIVCSPQHVMALSITSGRVFWRYKLTPGFQHRHITLSLAGNNLYVPHHTGIIIVKALSGEYIGTLKVPGRPCHVTLLDNCGVITTQKGASYLYR